MMKLSKEEFAHYMQEKIKPWNAKLGVWCEIEYEMYERDKKTLEETLNALLPMRLYNGDDSK